MNAKEREKYGCPLPYKPDCKALDTDIQNCKNAGGSTEFDCAQLAVEKFTRMKPEFKSMVYPWKNFDWDYTRYVDNNYSSADTGVTDEGSFRAIIANPTAMVKLAKGYLLDPNPGNNAQALVDDLTKCERVPAGDRSSCYVMNNIRASYNNIPQPTISNGKGKPPSNFLNKNKLNGDGSSSYYYKMGTCAIDMPEKECKKNNYEYIGETCYRPRYNYLNNAPYKGNVPSVIKGLFNIEPINLWSVYNGTPLRGLEIEECPIYVKKEKTQPNGDKEDKSTKKSIFQSFKKRNDKEYFNSVNETTHIFNVMIIIAFLLCIIGVIVFLVVKMY
jgi:hypothetical protein